MNKPNNPKCDTCFVKNNVLRCWNCKYKTKEWMDKNVSNVMIRGEKDLYKPKTENEDKPKLAHISIAVIDGCKNLEDSFGEICVRCNECGRFDETESEGKNG